MKQIKEFFLRYKNNAPLRNALCWKIIGYVEMFFNIVYKVMAHFVPAIVFMLIGQDFIGIILLIAGLLKLIYSIFQRNSFKEIWLLMRWKRYGK